MLDFDLDCTLTKNGWFVVKGWLSGEAGQYTGLEEDVVQQVCGGTGGSGGSTLPPPPPFPASGHVAKCGYINVFHYDLPHCTIEVFP